MRGSRLARLTFAALILFAAPHPLSAAQDGGGQALPDSLRGGAAIPEAPEPPRLAPHINDDKRQIRNYPEQPPVIPHSVRGYEITRNVNKCLSCHSRRGAPAAGAPMISVSHFMDRDYIVLTQVSPRRYFCNQCHVPQTSAPELVENEFVDGEDLPR